jgi:hypothetical protein
MKSLISVILLALIFSATCANAETTASEKQKTCFKCNGSGTAKCSTCVLGFVNCPASCLKKNVGVWEHLTVPGHDPKELWQKVYYTENGKTRYTAWTQAHVGDLIVSKPGLKPENKGRCPSCEGITKVRCPKCQGSGTQPCTMCEGKTTVPESWSETSNPKVASDPNYIQLKDGRVIHGKIVLTSGEDITIRPADGGRDIKTKKDQVIPKSQPAKK